MKIHFRPTRLAAWLPLFICTLSASANVKMPAIFGDHMVLQRETRIPVWGWAAAGERVKVSLGSQTAETSADASGAWHVDLKPLPKAMRNAPQELTVAGANTITFHDVLTGDVWVASGQSNMEFGVNNLANAADTIAHANDPLIRIFAVPRAHALNPQEDIMTGGAPFKPEWQLCTPESIAKNGTWNGFSAVAYFFGREIRAGQKVPVGLIESSYGGTSAHLWTSIDGYKREPTLAKYAQQHQALVDHYAQATADFPKVMADYRKANDDWKKAAGDAYEVELQAWTKKATEAAALRQPVPRRPAPAILPPARPVPPDGGLGAPGSLYNGMIAPLIPYAIKGVIWYQGESDAHDYSSAQEYATLFSCLIKDWRIHWGEGDFPFLFVQLAGYGAPAKTPSEGSWPWLREAQAKALSVPKTGMATAIDLGDPGNIHPKDKLDVGLRLALCAKHVAYGESVVYSGPVYDSMEVKGNAIALSFKEIGGRLKMGTPPWTYNGVPAVPLTELTGFGIAGADQKWFWAKAVIDGNKVTVSSDKVPAPAAVRYGWGSYVPVNLYNKEGLPAAPFRTDNWTQ